MSESVTDLFLQAVILSDLINQASLGLGVYLDKTSIRRKWSNSGRIWGTWLIFSVQMALPCGSKFLHSPMNFKVRVEVCSCISNVIFLPRIGENLVLHFWWNPYKLLVYFHFSFLAWVMKAAFFSVYRCVPWWYMLANSYCFHSRWGRVIIVVRESCTRATLSSTEWSCKVLEFIPMMHAISVKDYPIYHAHANGVIHSHSLDLLTHSICLSWSLKKKSRWRGTVWAESCEIENSYFHDIYLFLFIYSLERRI